MWNRNDATANRSYRTGIRDGKLRMAALLHRAPTNAIQLKRFVAANALHTIKSFVAFQVQKSMLNDRACKSPFNFYTIRYRQTSWIELEHLCAREHVFFSTSFKQLIKKQLAHVILITTSCSYQRWKWLEARNGSSFKMNHGKQNVHKNWQTKNAFTIRMETKDRNEEKAHVLDRPCTELKSKNSRKNIHGYGHLSVYDFTIIGSNVCTRAMNTTWNMWKFQIGKPNSKWIPSSFAPRNEHFAETFDLLAPFVRSPNHSFLFAFFMLNCLCFVHEFEFVIVSQCIDSSLAFI